MEEAQNNYIFREESTSFLANNVTKQKIINFSTYHQGWCYGSGLSFNKKTIETALKVNNLVEQNFFSVTDAFPGENGEILVTVYQEPYFCDITVNANGMFDIIFEKNDEEIKREENIDLTTVISLLEEFRKISICGSSDSYTQNIMIQLKNALQAWPLKTPRRAVGYRLWRRNASLQRAAYVTTSSNITTQRLPVVRLSSGNFRPANYHQATG